MASVAIGAKWRANLQQNRFCRCAWSRGQLAFGIGQCGAAIVTVRPESVRPATCRFPDTISKLGAGLRSQHGSKNS